MRRHARKRDKRSGRAKEPQKAEIVSELRQRFPLQELSWLSDMQRSTYYYHLKQRKTDKYSNIKQEIVSIFTANKQRYGYRRILFALRQQGIKLNHKTVHRLMRSMELHGKRRSDVQKRYGDVICTGVCYTADVLFYNHYNGFIKSISQK